MECSVPEEREKRRGVAAAAAAAAAPSAIQGDHNGDSISGIGGDDDDDEDDDLSSVNDGTTTKSNGGMASEIEQRQKARKARTNSFGVNRQNRLLTTTPLNSTAYATNLNVSGGASASANARAILKVSSVFRLNFEISILA